MKHLAWLLLACSLIVTGCDSEEEPIEPEAGETAGDPAGEDAGAPAGEDAGTPAGDDAGDPAGEDAGTPAGDDAGAPAGEPAGMPAGTSMPNICNEIIDSGAACDTSNDCCALGSSCRPNAETGTEGTCIRKCEIPAEGEPLGCEERELCVVDGEEGPDGVTPGYCLPSDNCEPGNEELGCGEGEFHCVRVDNISLCVDISNVPAEAVVGEGEACDVFNEESFCAPGFTCEFDGVERVCRAACDGDSDCGDGETCLDYTEVTDGLTYKFCSPVCDITSRDCGDAGTCILTDILNETIFGTCHEVGADNIAALGEACRNSFDDDDALGFCGAGTSCETNGVDAVCTALCADDAACGEGGTCVSAVNRYGNEYFNYGICVNQCDVANQDCGETGYCAFTDVIDEVLYGSCVELGADTPRAAAGEVCRNMFADDEESLALPFCQTGLTCEFNGIESICTQICSNGTECADGSTCVDATERYSEIFEYDFCAKPCDAIAQDCADGEACAFNGIRDGIPSGECVASPAAGEALNGEACTSVEGDGYWGSCAANNVCFLNEEGSTDGTCGSFCTQDAPETCDAEGQICAASSIEGLGLCQTTCSIFTNEGCDAGESCIWVLDEAPNGSGEQVPVGFCEENENIAQVGRDEPCVKYAVETADGPFEWDYFNNCQAGDACLLIAEGQPPVCLQSCNPSAADPGCDGGIPCVPIWEGADIESVGVCFEQ